MAFSEDNLIWIDLEMTGLKPEADRILEIATIVTDPNLNVLAEGPVFAIYQSESVLDGMDDWNVLHHSQSGLVQRVADEGISEVEAEAKTLEFVGRFVPARRSPMCGNSICQDRRFLYRYMPRLEAYFHYRHVDVSTLKELARRWAPSVASGYAKESAHQALADIRDSIDELRYYRTQLFRDSFALPSTKR